MSPQAFSFVPRHPGAAPSPSPRPPGSLAGTPWLSHCRDLGAGGRAPSPPGAAGAAGGSLLAGEGIWGSFPAGLSAQSRQVAARQGRSPGTAVTPRLLQAHIWPADAGPKAGWGRGQRLGLPPPSPAEPVPPGPGRSAGMTLPGAGRGHAAPLPAAMLSAAPQAPAATLPACPWPSPSNVLAIPDGSRCRTSPAWQTLHRPHQPPGLRELDKTSPARALGGTLRTPFSQNQWRRAAPGKLRARKYPREEPGPA